MVVLDPVSLEHDKSRKEPVSSGAMEVQSWSDLQSWLIQEESCKGLSNSCYPLLPEVFTVRKPDAFVDLALTTLLTEIGLSLRGSRNGTLKERNEAQRFFDEAHLVDLIVRLALNVLVPLHKFLKVVRDLDEEEVGQVLMVDVGPVQLLNLVWADALKVLVSSELEPVPDDSVSGF